MCPNVAKCMSCHKAIMVITGRAHCFHDYIYLYIYIYICNHENKMPFWLSAQWLCGNSRTLVNDVRLYMYVWYTVCVVYHLWPLIYLSICLSVYLSISIYLYIYLSIYLSIYIYIYISAIYIRISATTNCHYTMFPCFMGWTQSSYGSTIQYFSVLKSVTVY